MTELDYPFDSGYIMKKKKHLKRALLENSENSNSFLKKRVAVLGGSTTSDIVSVLELFLLNNGIKAEFYESEYAQYRQDALFPPEELTEFKPDIIYIHTSLRNLNFRPNVKMGRQEIADGLEEEMQGLRQIWDSLKANFGCPVIQNNFELPPYRLLGNNDAADYRGLTNFVTKLNLQLYDEIEKRDGLYLNDINYLSAAYGLDKWTSPEYWYMYKYSLNTDAIPYLCHNLASIIKAIFGKNKKALALDLDNTLWGGIVGDDGVENLAIGQETAVAMGFYQWQEYVKSLKDIGVLLTVCSKNEEENAIAGLNHPEGVLRPEDFTVIKANWLPKSQNIVDTAAEINILPEAIVLADDNPAERDIVRAEGICAPDIGEVGDYIRVIDRSGYFESVKLSEDDLRRTEMYRENALRKQAQSKYATYEEYLLALDMRAEIGAFTPVYIQRLSQLANKSNQFNVTTRRYTPDEMEAVASSGEYMTLYGKLIDKFGDNGVVSEVIGHIKEDGLHIDLWLMSCRVLKRDMEFAMLDEVVKLCRERGIEKIFGYYYPTAKNKMVKELFKTFGFEKQSEDENGNAVWSMSTEGYENKNKVIKVN